MKYIEGILLILFTQFGYSQLTTNSNATPSYLVQNVLLGNGVMVSNISYTGVGDAIGSFNGSNCNIGLGSGVIMTTGTVKNQTSLLGKQQGPFGPNDEAGAGIDNNAPGDPQLDNICTASTYNAAVLEFDFQAVGNNVSFNYVFASEEYLEYVNAGYNDVFGFFISGANPSGGNYSNHNIAIIPGTNIPVTIDNLNNVNNSSYYIDNGDGSSPPQNSDDHVVQYDGFTKVLTASADVVCGETYHIKIAIADAGDGIYDSGVFLEAQSFTSTPSLSVSSQVTSPGNLANNQILEGCGNATITFTRYDSLNYAQTFSLTYSGTGTNGTDYTNLPSSITFPVGSSSQSINLQTIYDQLSEGSESVTVTITFSGQCNENQTEDVTLFIVDQTPMQLSMLDQVTVDCPGTPEYLVASVTGGASPYSYTWSTGETGSYIYANPDSTSMYYVTATDVCGNQTVMDSIKVIVPIYDSLQLTISNDTTLICPNTPVDLFSDVTGGAGNYSWNWSSGDNVDDITVQTLTTDTYYLTVTDMCGNSINDSVTVTILIPVLQIEPYGATTICPGDSTEIGVVATSGAGYYEYLWNTGDTTADIIVSPYTSFLFHVSVSDSCATYNVEDSVFIGVVKPVADFTALPEDIIINSEVNFVNQSSGATSYYWDLGNGETSTETNPVTTYPDDGKIDVMLVAYNASGCADTTTQTIIVHPEMIFFVPNAFTPNGDGKNDYFAGDGVGVKFYKLLIFDRWGHVIFESDDQRLKWDGRINGTPAPEDVYVWKYELRGYDQTEFKRIGHVSLIR